MTFVLPTLAILYDRVTDEWPPGSVFPTRWLLGAEPLHTFPRDEVKSVGRRLGECAWTGFVDTSGVFIDEYARPLR